MPHGTEGRKQYLVKIHRSLRRPRPSLNPQYVQNFLEFRMKGTLLCFLSCMDIELKQFKPVLTILQNGVLKFVASYSIHTFP